MGILEHHPDRCPDALLVINLLLVVILTCEVVLQVLGSGSLGGAFWMGAVTNVPVYVGVVLGVSSLKRSSVAPRYYPRVVRWSVGGGVVLTVLVGVFTPTIYATWVDRLAVLRWSFTVGIGGGFYAGYFSARLVDQRVEAERALVRAEEATERQELLEYLNALLRHEVLNATNVVHGRSVVLDERLGDDPEATEHLDAIKRQSEEMADVVTDVRVLLQANENDRDRHEVDVVAVIHDEIQKLEDRHDDVQATTALPDAAMVSANDLLARVFENLFRNAAQHARTSPVRLEVSGTKSGGRFTVEVRDNGPGIPEHLRDDLFTPAVNRLDEDHGIGTVIVGRLVDQYDGDIWIRETGPDGTTIVLALPLATARAADSTGDPLRERQ